MTAPRLVVMLAVLVLLFPALPVHPQSQACRQYLMRHDALRQLYARGDGIQVRVPTVPNVIEGLTAARVYGLHDPEAPQFLNVSVNVGHSSFVVFLSLRHWTDDIGYGLAGERPCGAWAVAARTATTPNGCSRGWRST